jgi:hypothetical protein
MPIVVSQRKSLTVTLPQDVWMQDANTILTSISAIAMHNQTLAFFFERSIFFSFFGSFF